jgi:hypothetical protein
MLASEDEEVLRISRVCMGVSEALLIPIDSLLLFCGGGVSQYLVPRWLYFLYY